LNFFTAQDAVGMLVAGENTVTGVWDLKSCCLDVDISFGISNLFAFFDKRTGEAKLSS